MKKIYQTPVIRAVEIAADIICTSPTTPNTELTPGLGNGTQLAPDRYGRNREYDLY